MACELMMIAKPTSGTVPELAKRQVDEQMRKAKAAFAAGADERHLKSTDALTDALHEENDDVDHDMSLKCTVKHDDHAVCWYNWRMVPELELARHAAASSAKLTEQLSVWHAANLDVLNYKYIANRIGKRAHYPAPFSHLPLWPFQACKRHQERRCPCHMWARYCVCILTTINIELPKLRSAVGTRTSLARASSRQATTSPHLFCSLSGHKIGYHLVSVAQHLGPGVSQVARLQPRCCYARPSSERLRRTLACV